MRQSTIEASIYYLIYTCIILRNYLSERNKYLNKLRHFTKYLAKTISMQNNSKNHLYRNAFLR